MISRDWRTGLADAVRKANTHEVMLPATKQNRMPMKPSKPLRQVQNEPRRPARSGECGDCKAAAFAFQDALAVLGALALLGIAAAPLLANNKVASQRAVCVNNLGLVGRAFALWSADHGDRYPIQVSSSDGGTRNHPSGLNNNAWFQFAFISNELVTPKILACPADPQVNATKDFSPTDGFLSPNMRNNAVSYILGWPYVEDGRLVLCGDRDISNLGGTSSSSSGIGPVTVLDRARTRWLGKIHPGGDLLFNEGLVEGSVGGDLLFNDGSVEQVDTDGLRSAMAKYPPSSSPQPSRAEFLYPRGSLYP